MWILYTSAMMKGELSVEADDLQIDLPSPVVTSSEKLTERMTSQLQMAEMS